MHCFAQNRGYRQPPRSHSIAHAKRTLDHTSTSSPQHMLLATQRRFGNQAVQRMTDRTEVLRPGGNASGQCHCGGSCEQCSTRSTSHTGGTEKENVLGKNAKAVEGGQQRVAPVRATYEWSDPDAIDYARQIGDVVGTFEAANAGSACNLDTGNYDIVFNNNLTCTRDCSQFHEERHQEDLGPCCQAAAARVAAGADRRQTQLQWNNWVTSGAGPWSECNAHAISVACGQSVQSFNNCDAASSQCCADAQFYVDRQRRGQIIACATAPKDKPTCPF